MIPTVTTKVGSLISLRSLLTVLIILYVISVFIPYLFKPDEPRPLRDNTWSHTEGPPGPDRALLIQSPQDALNVRLTLLREARESLDISYYAIRNDPAGIAFIHELLNAADRGVKVRLILDGKMGLPSPVNRRVLAAHENIQVARYNVPKLWKPWRLNENLHDKFIVADSTHLLLGGRNIESQHYVPENSGRIVKYDWDVLVETESADHPESVIPKVEAYHAQLMAHSLTEHVKIPSERSRMNALTKDRQTIEESARLFQDEYPQYYTKHLVDYETHLLPTERIGLLHNPLTPGRKTPWLAQDLQELAFQAETSVFIQTPYATSTPDMLADLTELANQVDVTYLTNSPGSTPNLPAFSNYYFQRKNFVDTGIDIYEFQSTDSIHGKAYILDEKISIVGSFNLDSRSRYISTETMLVIDSVEFTKSMKEESNEFLLQSLVVGPDNEYQQTDEVQEVKAPPLKKILMAVIYVLLKPVQFFL